MRLGNVSDTHHNRLTGVLNRLNAGKNLAEERRTHSRLVARSNEQVCGERQSAIMLIHIGAPAVMSIPAPQFDDRSRRDCAATGDILEKLTQDNVHEELYTPGLADHERTPPPSSWRLPARRRARSAGASRPPTRLNQIESQAVRYARRYAAVVIAAVDYPGSFTQKGASAQIRPTDILQRKQRTDALYRSPYAPSDTARRELYPAASSHP